MLGLPAAVAINTGSWLQVLLFSIIEYFMVHFEFDAGKFFFFVLNLAVAVATMAYLGMARPLSPCCLVPIWPATEASVTGADTELQLQAVVRQFHCEQH